MCWEGNAVCTIQLIILTTHQRFLLSLIIPRYETVANLPGCEDLPSLNGGCETVQKYGSFSTFTLKSLVVPGTPGPTTLTSFITKLTMGLLRKQVEAVSVEKSRSFLNHFSHDRRLYKSDLGGCF